MNNGEYSDSIYIDGSRNIYTDIDKDVTIIEIDNKSFIKFLDIDEDIYKENPNKYFKNISVYIIHYEKGKKTKFSNGLIKCIEEDDYTIRHICPTEHGSSGSPILNLNNYKVIGVHKGTKEGKNWNLGTILKSPIDDFIKEISKEREINILLHNKCVSKKTVKVIDSLFSLRNKLRNDIKEDFFFVDYDEVDKNDENNIIIKEILKNNKDIEICYNLVIDKYSNTNPESNHELVYQYYYDKFNTDDYKKAYVILFVGKSGDGKTRTLNSLLNIIKGINLDSNKRFSLTNLDDYKHCSPTEGFHLYYLKDYSNAPIILIDTPGFCNSSKEIIKNDEKINELFYYIFSNIIEHINLICFTTKDHRRVTSEELYCLCNIMNLFSKDIKDNFINLITFANRDIIEEGPSFISNIIKYLNIEDKINENNIYCFDNCCIYKNLIDKYTEYTYNQLYKFYHEKVKNSKYLSTKKCTNLIDYRNNLKNKFKNLKNIFIEYFEYRNRNKDMEKTFNANFKNKNKDMERFMEYFEKNKKDLNDSQNKIRKLISEIKNMIKNINEISIYPDYNKILDYFNRYIDDCRYKKDFNNEERNIIKNKKAIIEFIHKINKINNEDISSLEIEVLYDKIK